MVFNTRSAIWATILAFTYILSAITQISALPSANINFKTPNICYGSQRFSLTDLKATKCDVLVGSTWLVSTGIETLVRLDEDHYFISDGEHSLYLNGSVRVDPYGGFVTLEAPGNGRIALTLGPAKTIQPTDEIESANTTMGSHTMSETGMLPSGLARNASGSSLAPLVLSATNRSTADSLIVTPHTSVKIATEHASSILSPSYSSLPRTTTRCLEGKQLGSRTKSDALSGMLGWTQRSMVLAKSTVIVGGLLQSNQKSVQSKPLTNSTQTRNSTEVAIPTVTASKSLQSNQYLSRGRVLNHTQQTQHFTLSFNLTRSAGKSSSLTQKPFLETGNVASTVRFNSTVKFGKLIQPHRKSPSFSWNSTATNDVAPTGSGHLEWKGWPNVTAMEKLRSPTAGQPEKTVTWSISAIGTASANWTRSLGFSRSEAGSVATMVSSTTIKVLVVPEISTTSSVSATYVTDITESESGVVSTMVSMSSMSRMASSELALVTETPTSRLQVSSSVLAVVSSHSPREPESDTIAIVTATLLSTSEGSSESQSYTALVTASASPTSTGPSFDPTSDVVSTTTPSSATYTTSLSDNVTDGESTLTAVSLGLTSGLGSDFESTAALASSMRTGSLVETTISAKSTSITVVFDSMSSLHGTMTEAESTTTTMVFDSTSSLVETVTEAESTSSTVSWDSISSLVQTTIEADLTSTVVSADPISSLVQPKTDAESTSSTVFPDMVSSLVETTTNAESTSTAVSSDSSSSMAESQDDAVSTAEPTSSVHTRKLFEPRTSTKSSSTHTRKLFEFTADAESTLTAPTQTSYPTGVDMSDSHTLSWTTQIRSHSAADLDATTAPSPIQASLSHTTIGSDYDPRPTERYDVRGHNHEHRKKKVATVGAIVLGATVVGGGITYKVWHWWDTFAKLFKVSRLDFWNLIRDIVQMPIDSTPNVDPQLLDVLGQGIEQIIQEEIVHPGTTLTEEQIEQIREVEGPEWVTPLQPEPGWLRWPIMKPITLPRPGESGARRPPDTPPEEAPPSSPPGEAPPPPGEAPPPPGEVAPPPGEALPPPGEAPPPPGEAPPAPPPGEAPPPPPPAGSVPPPTCGTCTVLDPPPGIDRVRWVRINQESIDLAKTLPPVPPAKLMPGNIGWVRVMPPEYYQLTLDGKITYARKIGESVFDSVLKYADGSSAAVNPTNTPLDPGFILDPAGHVLEYMGTTVQEVEILRAEQQGMDQARKANFKKLIDGWENMERSTQSIRDEEARLKKVGSVAGPPKRRNRIRKL